MSNQIQKELAMRELEKRHKPQRESLVEFLKYYFEKEKNLTFHDNWHYYVIENELKKILSGENNRLIINIPPGTGKTEFITKSFPVWAMGNNPTIDIMATGYSTSLTQEFSGQARDYYTSETYKHVFPRRPEIRQDQNTKEYWKNEEGGSYFGTGVGGSITGRRTNCLTGDTIVITRNGKKRIDDIYNKNIDVLSYNHTIGKVEWKPIIGNTKNERDTIYKIETSTGDRIRGSGEHKFFVLGCGYKEAKDLREGDEILKLEELGELLKSKMRKMKKLSRMLFQKKKEGGFTEVWLLGKGGKEKYVRNKKSKKKETRIRLLGFKMFLKSPISEIWKQVGSVRLTKNKEDSQILLKRVQRNFRKKEQKTTRNIMSTVLGGIQTNLTSNKVLQLGMQEQKPQGKHDEKEKSKLSARHVTKQVPKRILQNKVIYTESGQVLHCMGFNGKSCSTSQRQRPKKQRGIKSLCCLFKLSHYTSFIKKDTISRITTTKGRHVVYDIQVKDNNNFFANGILVHNCFIIDDPIKPDEADKSAIVREGVNTWFSNTVLSRLYNPDKDSVIIIMQRTHDNDLCGYLINRMKEGTGEEYTVLSLPAIADHDETYEIGGKVYGRRQGEPLDQERFPLTALDRLRKSLGLIAFECQYQQNPLSKLSREFHEEWFLYFDEMPSGGRIFTAVDPAFTKKEYSDYSAIVTCKFIDDRIYILGYTVGKYDPGELVDEIIKHYMLYGPEKIGVEAVQAQRVIGQVLKNTLQSQGKYVLIEDIVNTGDKDTRIRGLIPHFRDARVHIKRGIEAKPSLEDQLIAFPRGTHDDIPDALQMCLSMYTLTPNTKSITKKPIIKYNSKGKPILIQT